MARAPACPHERPPKCTMQVLASCDRLPRDVFSPDFISGILRGTRVFSGNNRNAGPDQLATIARSLHLLGHRPDFGFTHNFAQAARLSWTGFSSDQVGRRGRGLGRGVVRELTEGRTAAAAAAGESRDGPGGDSRTGGRLANTHTHTHTFLSCMLSHTLTHPLLLLPSSCSSSQYADLLAAMACFDQPAAIDALWACEFLALIQCHFDSFRPAAMSRLLLAVVDLPALNPGAQWLALAVARWEQAGERS